MSSDASKIPTITGDLHHVQHQDITSKPQVRTNLQFVCMQRHAEQQKIRSKPTNRSATSFLSFFPSSAVSFTRKDRRRPNCKTPRFNLLGKPIDEKLLKNRKRLAYIRKVQFLTHNFLERPDSKSAISYHILQ